MKIAVLYYSKTGKTREMAEVIAKGVQEIDGMEAKTFALDDIDREYLLESRAVIIGTPTYHADLCWQVKKWFDEDSKGLLAGKLGAAFATANYAQGGADIAIQTILGHMLVSGMMVYSGGAALGQPFIHLGAVALKDNFEESKPMFQIFGKRIAQMAEEAFFGDECI